MISSPPTTNMVVVPQGVSELSFIAFSRSSFSRSFASLDMEAKRFPAATRPGFFSLDVFIADVIFGDSSVIIYFTWLGTCKSTLVRTLKVLDRNLKST